MEQKQKKLMSIAAYARHRKSRGLPGGSRQAIYIALEYGRIFLDYSGKIDPDVADKQWLERTEIRMPPIK